MKICENVLNFKYNISFCTSKYVKINSKCFFNNVVLKHNMLIDNWKIYNFPYFIENDFNFIFTLLPNILILGTGKNFVKLNNKVLSFFSKNNILVESMNTISACKTYIALLNENKNIVVALVI